MKRRILAMMAVALVGLVAVALFVWRPWEQAAGDPLADAGVVAGGASARAAVIDGAGNLAVVTSDPQSGPAVIARLTEDAGGAVTYLQPTPAPDGRQIAYVAVTAKGARVIVRDLEQGSVPRTVFESAGQRPFYLYWSPDSRSLAFLASDSAMHLYVVGADGQGAAVEIREGQPSYFAWTADSMRLLLHTNGGAPRGSIARQTLGGSLEVFDDAPGDFQAPAWGADGTTRYVVLSDGRRNQLAALGSPGEERRDLTAATADAILFTLSPDGARIAYQTLGVEGNRRSPIHVIDAAGQGAGSPRDLDPVAPLAFFWSPDGTRIAALVAEPRGVGPSGDRGVVLAARSSADAQPNLRWEVAALADGKAVRFAPFAPSAEFLALVPYFDQYAASLALWSPDGKRLIYGTAGGVEALNVSDGTVAKISDGTQGFWVKGP